MEEVRGPAGRNMWQKLTNVQPALLANYLKTEYPQTIAVILSKLRADHTARVLCELPPPLADQVVNRMLTMGPVPRDVIQEIDGALRKEFIASLTRSARRDPHEQMADIMNQLGRSDEMRFIGSISRENPDAAKKIKSLMFTFDDLTRLSGPAVQTLLRYLDKSLLATALKGASEDLRTLFFDNMSQRASKLLREEMNESGPPAPEGRGRSPAIHHPHRQAARGRWGSRRSAATATSRRWCTDMTSARKFTFDEEFGTEGAGRSRSRAQEQSRLQEAEQEGFVRGQIEGRREAEQEAAMRLAVSVEKLAATAASVLARLDQETLRFEREAATLALAFARKLAGDAALRAPLAALESAAADCFRQLVGVPHIVVRMEQGMIDQAQDHAGPHGARARVRGTRRRARRARAAARRLRHRVGRWRHRPRQRGAHRRNRGPRSNAMSRAPAPPA